MAKKPVKEITPTPPDEQLEFVLNEIKAMVAKAHRKADEFISAVLNEAQL